MNVADVIRRVGRSIGDTDQILISNADIFDWINEAQREICERTKCLTTTITSAASTYPKVVPTDWISTERILYDSVALSEIAINQLDAVGTDLGVRQSYPYYYYYRARNINLFPLQPNGDTTVITMDYANYPVDVTVIGDLLGVPEIYHSDIVSYSLAKAHERNENQAGYNQAMERFASALAEDADTGFNKTNNFPIIQDDPYEDW